MVHGVTMGILAREKRSIGLKVRTKQPKKPYYKMAGGRVFTELPPRMKVAKTTIRRVCSDEQMKQNPTNGRVFKE